MLISKYFLRKVTWIMLRNMENLEKLLKRFKESKAFSSDEIEPNIYFILKTTTLLQSKVYLIKIYPIDALVIAVVIF